MAVTIKQLISPARSAMLISALLAGIGAILSIVPYVALTELASIFLSDGSGRIWMWVIIAVVALFLSNMLYGIGVGIAHIGEAKLRYWLRKDLVRALGRIPLGAVDQTSSGKIRKMVVDDTTAIHTLVAHVAGDLTYGLVALLTGMGYLLWVDWRMMLMIFAVWIIVFGLTTVPYLRKMNETVEAFGAAQTELSAATVEMVQGVKEIKNFQGANLARTRFNKAREDFSREAFDWVHGVGRSTAMSMGFMHPAVVFATVAPIAVWFVSQGWIEPAHTVPFFLIAVGVPKGLMQLISLAQHIYEARQAAAGGAKLMSIPPMPEGDVDPQLQSNAALPIEIDHITFGYDEDTPVINDVSLSIPAGSITALVGPSGGGKTTLARLLARFYDVDSGSIRIDGTDLREVSFSWLLSRVALVFQDISLTHDTVRNNIALGNPDASQKEIEAAAKAACIHERITELPNGYDQVIGDAGGVLSGGEAQRLTIARAYLQNTPILILDEATAQADPQSEREIHRALASLSVGKTVIVIAHRLATVVGADQIAVIDDGRLVDCAKHSELVERCPLYAHMWQAQQQPAFAANESEQ